MKAKSSHSGQLALDKPFARHRAEEEIGHAGVEEENKEALESEDEEIFFDANEELIIDEIQNEYASDCTLHRPSQLELHDEWRTTLPDLRAQHKISVWQVLKDSIGKDLTKFCVPVYFNEPISML